MSETAHTPSDPRLVARVDRDTQRFIAQAAELSGCSISQFIIDAAREKAERISEQTYRIRISREAADRMLEKLDAPAYLNQDMIAAVRHTRGVLKGDAQDRTHSKKP